MHPADDKRALFIRVVDDIVDQIRTGKLKPDDVLPTSRKMADIYDIASMTAQRALRELQTMGLTYGVVGKGTFVHPEAPNRIKILDGKPVQSPAGPTISPELAQHLLTRDAFAAKTVEWMENLRDKPKAAQLEAEMRLLQAILEGQRQDLKDEIGKYQADLAQAAGPLADTPDQPPAEETPKTTQRRTPKK